MTNAMKKKKDELDVDVIGGEGTLTTEEEKALSAYFQQKRLVKSPTANGDKGKPIAGKKTLVNA